MQIVLAFILNLNPLATPPHSPLSIRPHVPCPGGTLRGGSSQEQVDEGGLRGRAEHSIPHLSQKHPLWEQGVWDEAPQLPKTVGGGCWGEKRNGDLGKPSQQLIPASIP